MMTDSLTATEQAQFDRMDRAMTLTRRLLEHGFDLKQITTRVACDYGQPLPKGMLVAMAAADVAHAADGRPGWRVK